LEDCKAGKDVALLSERLLQSYGFPPLVHSIGHGVGMEVHEYPSLGKQSKDELAAGTVLAIEPAAYFKRYGVRFEDMVLRTKKGWKRI
jgi:Xaa-Pro dipeptidase